MCAQCSINSIREQWARAMAYRIAMVRGAKWALVRESEVYRWGYDGQS